MATQACAMRYPEGLPSFCSETVQRCCAAVKYHKQQGARGRRGCEVAKRAFASEDVKSAALPPCEVPLTG